MPSANVSLPRLTARYSPFAFPPAGAAPINEWQKMQIAVSLGDGWLPTTPM